MKEITEDMVISLSRYIKALCPRTVFRNSWLLTHHEYQWLGETQSINDGGEIHVGVNGNNGETIYGSIVLQFDPQTATMTATLTKLPFNMVHHVIEWLDNRKTMADWPITNIHFTY